MLWMLENNLRHSDCHISFRLRREISARAKKWHFLVSRSITQYTNHIGRVSMTPAPNRGGTGILEAYSGGTRGPHRALRACYFTPVRAILFRSTSGSFCLQSCLGAMRPGKSKGTRGGDVRMVDKNLRHSDCQISFRSRREISARAFSYSGITEYHSM
jgi:hypothetical protein